jgi:Ca2+-transporting ATPase
VALILGAALFWPSASKLLRFGPLHPDDLAVTVFTGLMVLVTLELAKPVLRRWLQS